MSLFSCYFKGRDILSCADLSRQDILVILDQAKTLSADLKLHDATLANVFFEDSTRTRLSFYRAASTLGMSVLSFNVADGTSIKKGETLADTIRMLEANEANIFVLRHPLDGAAQWIADVLDFPVINAGDGTHEHPTQALLDLYSIRETQQTLEDLNIGLVGDLRYGRTIHSLILALLPFSQQKIYFVSPPQLELPKQYQDLLQSKNVLFECVRKIEDIINEVDILYMTRIQKERFPDIAEYEAVRNSYSLRVSNLSNVKKNLRILHPLPRNKQALEIETAVDQTPYAYYFQQAKNGLRIRRTLFGLLHGALGNGRTYHKGDISREVPHFNEIKRRNIKRKEEGYLAYEVKYGTIIDHIPAGRGVEILSHLSLPPRVCYAIGGRLPSGKLGQKDVVKLFDYHLTTDQMARIALIAPIATVNLVDSKGLRKGKVNLPYEIRDLVDCKNPKCISFPAHEEQVPSVFYSINNGYSCHYCDTFIPKEDITIRS